MPLLPAQKTSRRACLRRTGSTWRAFALGAAGVLGLPLVLAATSPASGAPGATTAPVPVPTVLVTPSLPSAVGGPPPGAVHLLDAVSSDEGQLISLAGIDEARTFLAEAEEDQLTAKKVLSRATARWDQARFVLGMARARQYHDERRVSYCQNALAQLALEEYTGGSSSTSSDIQAQEAEMDQTEMANAATGVTVSELIVARGVLAKENAVVAVDRRTVGARWYVVAEDRILFSAAQRQLALSRHDVQVARRWALQTGAAPLYPAEALLTLEGPLGRAALRRQKEEASTPTTTSRPGGPPTGTSIPGAPFVPTAAAASNAASPGTLAPTTNVPVTDFGGKLPPAIEGPSILGPSLLTEQQILGWFESAGVTTNLTTSIKQLVWDYLEAGRVTGVRADIAFAQSVVETGHFSFPTGGQLTAKDNNFAGIGACDSCKHGWSFPSAMAGVLSQEQLLESYASPVPEGRGFGSMAGSVQGCCTTWLALSGVWATNPDYGYEILGIYKEMLDWAIPRQLFSDGLISQSKFEDDELLLPQEDAETYALIAGAIASTGAEAAPKAASCATKSSGGLLTSTTSTTSTTVSVGATSSPAARGCSAAASSNKQSSPPTTG